MKKPVKSSIQYLSISYELALAIGTSLNLTEMLNEVIYKIVHKTNAHRGIIWVKNGEKELQPLASAGININNVPKNCNKIDHTYAFEQILKKQKYVLKCKDDKDFSQYCHILSGKEKSVLIVPVNDLVILHLVYASTEIADEPLANLLASLSKKLSVAIEACITHKNLINEVQVRKKTEKKLKKKTKKLLISEKELQKLYKESEQARKSLLSILEDIMQKEDALRESEEKLSQIVYGSSIATFVIDNKHKITHWNKACEKLTGLSAEQMCGTNNPWKAFYPKQRPMMADIVIDALPEKNIVKYYLEKFHKSSVIKNAYFAEDFFPNLGENGKWLFFTAAPIEDLDGDIIGAIETFQDITKRKQSEKIQKTLYNISIAVNTTDKMSDLYKKIKNFLGEIIDTTNFFVALYDEETDTVSLSFHVDEKDEFASFPAGKTLVKYVITTGKPLFATNNVIDELTKKGIVETIGSPSEIWLGVPLKIESQIIGVIAVQSYDDPNLYTERDIEILSFVSDEIALVIKHKQADEQIRKSLKEKTLLLQEIHHRTKNNMAVISAILSMQSRRSNNEYIQTTFKEINNKIKAMSLVHQKLYQAQDLSNINLKEYIEDLLNLIMQSYGVLTKKINIKFDLQDVNILIDSAIPLGLILNELISNIFKHAFPKNRSGEIFIRLYQENDGTINIHLEDNGIGISGDIDLRKNSSMGLTSVFSIAEQQLKGKISVDTKKGLKWHIILKDNLHRERI